MTKKAGRPKLTDAQRRQRQEFTLALRDPVKKRKRDEKEVAEFLKEMGLTSEQMHLIGLGQSINTPTALSTSSTFKSNTIVATTETEHTETQHQMSSDVNKGIHDEFVKGANGACFDKEATRNSEPLKRKKKKSI